jgi:hypothetical protein
MALIEVPDYGAVGDGVTDDTAALQRAHDAAKSGDQVVYEPGVVYGVDGNVGINIAGETDAHLMGATVRLLPRASTVPVQRAFSTMPGASDIRIRGGRLIGDMAQIPSGKHRIGVRIDSAIAVSIEETIFEGWKSDGIWVGGNAPSARVRISRVRVDTFGRNGISVVNAQIVDIMDCRFAHAIGPAEGVAPSPGAGVDIEPNANESVHDLSIYHCLAEDCEVGFYIHPGKGLPGRDSAIYGCESRYARRYGIIFNSVEGGAIENCRILVPAGVTGQPLPIGISMGGGNASVMATDVAICRNQIEGAGRGLILAGARDFIVANNQFAGGTRVEIVGLGIAGDAIFEKNEGLELLGTGLMLSELPRLRSMYGDGPGGWPD